MKLVNLPLCLEKDSVSVEASFFKTRTAFGKYFGKYFVGIGMTNFHRCLEKPAGSPEVSY